MRRKDNNALILPKDLVLGNQPFGYCTYEKFEGGTRFSFVDGAIADKLPARRTAELFVFRGGPPHAIEVETLQNPRAIFLVDAKQGPTTGTKNFIKPRHSPASFAVTVIFNLYHDEQYVSVKVLRARPPL